MRTSLLILSFIVVLSLHSDCAAAVPTWRAGAAKVSITPGHLMWMAGYSKRDRPAEGTMTELWAKALVLEDAHARRAILVTLDLVGIDRDLSSTICRELITRHGVSRADIAINVSHTHCGPVVGHNLAPLHYMNISEDQQQRVEAYAETLVSRVTDVVNEAMDKMTPCTLSWGNARSDFAVNRRNNAAATVPDARQRGALQGPHDHDVPVLAVRDADDRLKAIVFGYACHATTLDLNLWSGDYPGFAQQYLEDAHPAAVALFFAGCGADQNPLPRRSEQLARHYGQRLAIAVDEVVLTTAMRSVPAELTTSYAEVTLQLGTLPSVEQNRRNLQSDNPYTRARARLLESQLTRDGEFLRSYPFPLSVWQFGDEIQWVFLGGEVVVDYALRLKHELRGTRTWVAGYSHDVMAYIPSRRVLDEGGYEGGGAMVYYGLPAPWAPTVEATIIDAVRAQIDTRETGSTPSPRE